MKASELKKKSITSDSIIKSIKAANEGGFFRYCIQYDMYVSETVIAEIMNLGYKVFRGNWFGQQDCLIIEW